MEEEGKQQKRKRNEKRNQRAKKTKEEREENKGNEEANSEIRYKKIGITNVAQNMEKRSIKDREEGNGFGRDEKANVGGRVKSGLIMNKRR